MVDGDNVGTQETRAWVQVITERSIIIGEGSPSGVVEAKQGAQYMDKTGATGNILYIKQLADVSGDNTLGWELIG